MPNHCHNTLWLRGDDADVKNFVKQLEDARTDNGYEILPTFYPCPVPLAETKATFGKPNDEDHAAQIQRNLDQYGHKDWYSWCIANWGTKWGDYDTYMTDAEDDTVGFRFTSAWSPPIDGIAHVATLFPKIEFVLEYVEEGMGFYGITIYRNGLYKDDCRNFEDIDGFDKVAEDDNAYALVGQARRNLLIEYGYPVFAEDIFDEPMGF